jgi:hypothetical protein
MARAFISHINAGEADDAVGERKGFLKGKGSYTCHTLAQGGWHEMRSPRARALSPVLKLLGKGGFFGDGFHQMKKCVH